MNKFKKLIPLSLAIILLLSACNSKNSINTNGNDNGNNNSTKIKATTENPATWISKLDITTKNINYSEPVYETKFKNFDVANDLSNISNIDQFQGFTNEQKEALIKNHFFIASQNPNSTEKDMIYTKMYNLYEENEYKNIPNLITTDIALNTYAVFYEGIMEQVENLKLNNSLKKLTNDMYGKSLNAYLSEENEEIKAKLEKITVYFAIPNKILNNATIDISENANNLVEEEYQKILAANETSESKTVESTVNYRQFKPRGHYTNSEELKNYFKAMMWYGYIPFALEDSNGKINVENAKNAATITYLLFLDEDKTDINLWSEIYETTAIFSGDSDDLTVFDIENMIFEIFGENSDYIAYYDNKYDKAIEKAIKEMKGPEIQGKIKYTENVATKKCFKFIGQRYTIDGEILQELMFPGGNERPFPSALDVANVFNSKIAEEIEISQPATIKVLEKYNETTSKLKNKFQNIDDTTWMSNLYNGWLWTLETTLKTENANPENLPQYMRNNEYKLKNLVSFLGSYTELKHSNILYSKQPCAEKGSGEEIEAFPAYVEPNVELYHKLKWLSENSRQFLVNKNIIHDLSDENLWDAKIDYQEAEIISGFNALIEIYDLFERVAIAECEGKSISQEDFLFLIQIGGIFEYIEYTFNENAALNMQPSAKIVDIASLLDTGEFLEIGTGFPDIMYLVFEYDGQLYLSRGATYSFYQFASNTALTDEEWFEKMGIYLKDSSWYSIDYNNLMSGLPDRPDWTNELLKGYDNVTLPEAFFY